MKKLKNSQPYVFGPAKGYTLIELPVIMVVMTIILGILMTVIVGISKSYTNQAPRSDAMENASAGLDLIARLVRMAGNNPNNIASLQGISAGTKAADGFYHSITIRSDSRGNTAGSAPDGSTDDAFENVTFSVNNNQLLKRENPADASAVVFLDNIVDLKVSYFGANNVAISDAVTNQSQIRRVDIVLDTQVPDNPVVSYTTSVYLRLR